MEEIHAHEVLRMMEGKTYTEESLKADVIARFGKEQRFHTCSAQGMDIDALIVFLRNKGKFKAMDTGFTVDLDRVCSSY